MEFLGQLWLAIVLSAVAAWAWSFLTWAALGIHKKDFQRLPDEPRFEAAMLELGIRPGYYHFPHMEKCDMKDPAIKARWSREPMGILHLWTPKFSMARNMGLTLLTYLVVSVLMAYVGHQTLSAGAGFAKVFQVMGTIGVLAYTFAFIPNMIWFQGRGRVLALCVMDGIIQGLAVGAVFAAMWPKG